MTVNAVITSSSVVRTVKNVALGAALLSATACATTLSSNVETAADYRIDGFATYAWLGHGASPGNTHAPDVVNPINQDRIRHAIDGQLNDKGYRLVDPQQADFLVTATLGAKDRVNIRERYNALGYRYFGGVSRLGRFGAGFGHRGFGPAVSVDQFTEGVLVLDVFERRSREAVWHGAASKRLSRQFMAPELIDEAVMTLLEQFPDNAYEPPEPADSKTDRMS